MKAICFLISSDQKKYIFLLNQPRDGDNVGRDEYPVKTTPSLDILIRAEGGIRRNQQSDYDNCGGRGGRQKK